MESLSTLDQLSEAQPHPNKTQDVLGTLLADKFKLENKVMQKSDMKWFMIYLTQA